MDDRSLRANGAGSGEDLSASAALERRWPGSGARSRATRSRNGSSGGAGT